MERVYHTKRLDYSYANDPTKITKHFKENGSKMTVPSLHIHKTKKRLEGIEMYDGDTDVKILEFQKGKKVGSSVCI